jgi:hypothetical protein
MRLGNDVDDVGFLPLLLGAVPILEAGAAALTPWILPTLGIGAATVIGSTAAKQLGGASGSGETLGTKVGDGISNALMVGVILGGAYLIYKNKSKRR